MLLITLAGTPIHTRLTKDVSSSLRPWMCTTTLQRQSFSPDKCTTTAFVLCRLWGEDNHTRATHHYHYHDMKNSILWSDFETIVDPWWKIEGYRHAKKTRRQMISLFTISLALSLWCSWGMLHICRFMRIGLFLFGTSSHFHSYNGQTYSSIPACYNYTLQWEARLSGKVLLPARSNFKPVPGDQRIVLSLWTRDTWTVWASVQFMQESNVKWSPFSLSMYT